MSAPVDLGALRGRYGPPAPPCPECGQVMAQVRRGECAPPSDLYRCPTHPLRLTELPRRDDPAVIRLVEAYEELAQQVKIRPL